MRSLNYGHGPQWAKGTRVVIAVPFRGDADVFGFHPNQSTWNPPHARVAKDELLFDFEGIDQNGEQINADYRQTVGTINQWLRWLRDDIDPYV